MGNRRWITLHATTITRLELFLGAANKTQHIDLYMYFDFLWRRLSRPARCCGSVYPSGGACGGVVDGDLIPAIPSPKEREKGTLKN